MTIHGLSDWLPLHALKLISVSACLLVGLASAGTPTDSTSISLSETKAQALETRINQVMAEWKAPGATFAVGLGDRIVWVRGFGYSDIENRVPARPDTMYRTASIGKAMTATAAMMLADQGKLDLDAPLQKYCPRYPAKPYVVTVRDLISHTSGIRHYGGPNEQNELFNTKHYDNVSDAIDLFKDDALKLKPGTDFLYSTWGYVTLGCVLEGASGDGYLALMKHMIFDISGMANIRNDDPGAIILNRARGYELVDGALRNSRWVDMSSKMAAGGWVTTVPDLIRFMQATMQGRLVNERTLAKMLTPYELRNGDTVDNFGMGWFIDDYHGMKAGLYGGGTPEVAGIIFFVPEKKLAIAGIFNLENITGRQRIALAEGLADILLDQPTPNDDHFQPQSGH